MFPKPRLSAPSGRRPLRTALLAAAVTAALLGTAGGPAVPTAQAYEGGTSPAPPAPVAAAQSPQGPEGRDPHDEVLHLGKAPAPVTPAADAPGDHPAGGRTPGRQPTDDSAPGRTTTDGGAVPAAPRTGTAATSCTLDSVTRLAPEPFADFLADPAVTADGCLRGLIWTWDARLAPVMSDAHVQAVSRRITGLAGQHDGRNSSHLLEMFTYLHAVVYHDHSRDEIDVTDAPTAETMRRAIYYFGTARRTFDVTRTNAETLREALYTGSAPGLRHSQLDLIRKVLATMDRYHPETYGDSSWGGAVLAALSVNYLGLYSGNDDRAFRTLVARNDAYRAAFRAFADRTHLKGSPNEWTVRDALSEYARFGEIGSLRNRIVTDIGALLDPVTAAWGRGSAPWAKLASWLNHYEACKPYGVCKDDIERLLFPHTYTYDNGTIKVRTGLDRATVDQLYYASKQVKAQFHRVVGTETPLTGDTNSTLNIVLYASRADYENYHPLLTGMGTDNGGIYIERGATFYTYQRRVPQDSRLTLEELFRHEYVHYLNGRWAVPGYFGEGPWYQDDRTTAMDEGTAEFFDGATRDDGIAVRKSLVESVIRDTAGGGPRMTVDQILHATYAGDGFRFYSYAGTFFEYLWTERPALLKEMYRHLRADDPAAFDAWRDRLSRDAAIQSGYDTFLDRQIERVADLFVPDTSYTPNDGLRETTADAVRAAFAAATSATPSCAGNGDPGMPRFVCTGRVTARLGDAGSADQVFKDMSETVDYFLLDRAAPASPNLADMNCVFGEVAIWADRTGGTSDYTCEGPLRR
ncbi:collagenase [Streptomyces sp. TRM49041]|uniref:collagenase n=1 Tax=Streptomyces sp. TRM49041 TaxID=2603216 RepID=UPI0021CCD5E8|nr:collagenase [Streptomyces sp. TRM49041]